MPTYKLEFLASAAKDWRKLDSSVQSQFEKKLREHLAHPHVVALRLRELRNCYKIKLRKSGFRLIYRVDDDRIVVIVITVGKREQSEAYATAAKRLES